MRELFGQAVEFQYQDSGPGRHFVLLTASRLDTVRNEVVGERPKAVGSPARAEQDSAVLMILARMRHIRDGS